LTFNGLHGVISQKIELFTAVKTLNPATPFLRRGRLKETAKELMREVPTILAGSEAPK
jgi:hypothetical protein